MTDKTTAKDVPEKTVEKPKKDVAEAPAKPKRKIPDGMEMRHGLLKPKR